MPSVRTKLDAGLLPRPDAATTSAASIARTHASSATTISAPSDASVTTTAPRRYDSAPAATIESA